MDMQIKSSGSVRVFYPNYDTEWLVQEIRKKLEELNEKLSTSMVVLFGSFAKRNYTVASDVDLLVVYKGEEKEDAYVIVKSILDIPRLEPHVYSQREYEDMKGVISKMIEGGIVIGL
ncbi:MAG: nucleotidyltransferase domain-containing protein [Methanosarcinales archaeon]|nr:nucleotidyltransferase domain-containing protein [Methanosarcinales archaeon]